MPNTTIYVIDTSVLLYSANSLNSFGSSEIIIPYVVLEELDKFKTRDDVTGSNARHVTRRLNELRSFGSLSDGVPVNNLGGTLRVELNFSEQVSLSLDPQKNDDRILNVCLGLIKSGRDVVLVTKDINLSVRADVFGIKAEDFESDRAIRSVIDLYSGTSVVEVSSDIIDSFYSGQDIFPSDLDLEIYCNQYLTLVSNADPGKTALVRSYGEYNPLKRVVAPKSVWGIKPRNREQQFAIDSLLDPKLSLVSLTGQAGTGKSLISLACALHMVQDSNVYDRLIVSRPIQPLGKDIGFLPGPQPLDAKILTPNGWVLMGELAVGDRVISRDGRPTEVIGIYPKGTKSVYRITTTEGTTTECCMDHLWFTQTAEERKRKKPGKVRTTKDILETIEHNLPGKKMNNHSPRYGEIRPNHFLPRNEPVIFNKKELILPPYILGCILGDGSISDSISVSNTDKELIDRIDKELTAYGFDCSLHCQGSTISYGFSGDYLNNKPAKTVRLTNVDTGEELFFPTRGVASKKLNLNPTTINSRCLNRVIKDSWRYEFLPCSKKWQNPIKEGVRRLGLEGTKATTKFIPDEYKYTSIEDRIAVLQGLMDTDGTIKEETGEASFCTTSRQLALDVIEIVRSLGGRATLHSRDRRGKTTTINERALVTKEISYEFTITLPSGINPFYMRRKAERVKDRKFFHGIGILSVDYVGEKEVQCIMVSNPEHLYITDDYIVTHNTIEEKMSPWMGPIKDSLEFLMCNNKGKDKGRDFFSEMLSMGMLQVEPLTYIRGRSLPNTVFIVDESQDITKQEVKTIVSRMGENSKLILIGDVMQITNPYIDSTNNGLSHVIEKFKPYDFSSHVTLTKGERSILATVASEIL